MTYGRDINIGTSTPSGDAIETASEALNVLVGEVQASPTENTVLERLKALETSTDALGTILGAITASPTENTVNERLKALEIAVSATNTLIGEVAVSPTENSLLERLKTLETTIVLAAGSAAIGKLAANSGVDIGDVDITSVSGEKYTTPTHSAVTVGSSTTEVLAASATRLYVLLVNNSSEDIYIKLGAEAVMNQGIRINAGGGSYEMSKLIGNLYVGVINGICTSGSKILLATEGV